MEMAVTTTLKSSGDHDRTQYTVIIHGYATSVYTGAIQKNTELRVVLIG